MSIRMEGADVVLAGNWNISEVVGHIDTLSDILQRVDEKGQKTLQVDCGEIQSFDMNGLQLIKVWLQCARFRGMEPKLINISEGLQRIMLVTGFAPTDAGFGFDAS